MPSLLFHTQLAVPTSCWQVVHDADGCAAESQLIVGVAACAFGAANAGPATPRSTIAKAPANADRHESVDARERARIMIPSDGWPDERASTPAHPLTT